MRVYNLDILMHVEGSIFDVSHNDIREMDSLIQLPQSPPWAAP